MTTIQIATLARAAGTQFRAICEKGSKEHGRREANIEDMMDLIERDVPFKTPIRIARCNDTMYLVDGFHRVAAYERLEREEIPADRFVVVEASSIEEVRALAAGANVQHGKGNTQADYCNIIKRMMDLGDTYMKNAFEPDIKKIAEAIGAAQPAVGRGYNDYAGTEKNPVPTLSSVCKEKRDAAVMEQHKGGTSARKIGELFNLPNKTVSRIIEEVCQNPDSGKRHTPATPSVLPLANTEDRADTRVDADEFVDDFLSEYDDFISLAEDETESEPAPTFDLKAATGFGDDIATYTKREKQGDTAPWPTDEKVNPVKFQERYLARKELIEKLLAEQAADEEYAAAHGISLPM